MPRRPRIDIAGTAQHLIVRGNNRADLFRDDADRRIFMSFLERGLESSACDVHAYVLMTNHVHLLATGHVTGQIADLMHRVGSKFARVMNLRWGRTGTLFEGRFHSSVVDSESYLLKCMRYIELNPVRAGMARRPGDYFWSSYRDNAGGEPKAPLVAHPVYRRLGGTSAARGREYRSLVAGGVTEDDLTRIRVSARQCRALGPESFCRQVSEALGRECAPRERGRPQKGTG